MVHGVVPRRRESVEHHELPYRERECTTDLAALYPPAADWTGLTRPAREQSPDDVPSSLARWLVAHVGHCPSAGNRDARPRRNDGALSSEFPEEPRARRLPPG